MSNNEFGDHLICKKQIINFLPAWIDNVETAILMPIFCRSRHIIFFIPVSLFMGNFFAISEIKRLKRKILDFKIDKIVAGFNLEQANFDGPRYSRLEK
jgi:hypothetical protein